MDPDDLEAIRGPARQMMQIEDMLKLTSPRPSDPFPERLPLTEIPIEEKWKIFALFWERARKTEFLARCILIAIEGAFRYTRSDARPCQPLSEALQASNQKGRITMYSRNGPGSNISVN